MISKPEVFAQKCVERRNQPMREGQAGATAVNGSSSGDRDLSGLDVEMREVRPSERSQIIDCPTLSPNQARIIHCLRFTGLMAMIMYSTCSYQAEGKSAQRVSHGSGAGPLKQPAAMA